MHLKDCFRSSQSNPALLLSATVGALEMTDPLMSGTGPGIKCLPKIKITTEHKKRQEIQYSGLFIYQRSICLVFKSSKFYLTEPSCSFAVVLFD